MPNRPFESTGDDVPAMTPAKPIVPEKSPDRYDEDKPEDKPSNDK
jgi:hypothetical protein